MCEELEAKTQKLDNENNTLREYRALQNDKMTDLEAKIEKLHSASTVKQVSTGISVEREKVLLEKISYFEQELQKARAKAS